MNKNQSSLEKQKGITLIALVITIIVLLILAGVSVSLVVGNNGVLTQASTAVITNREAAAKEQVEMAVASAESEYWAAWAKDSSVDKNPYYTYTNLTKYIPDNIGSITGNTGTVPSDDGGYTVTYHDNEQNQDYTFIVYGNGKAEKKEVFNAEEWDKTAADLDAFIWASDDASDPDYGKVVGYTSKAQNYTTLRYPTRCTKIGSTDNNYIEPHNDKTQSDVIRSYTKNIKKIELPETVTEIERNGISGNNKDYCYFFDELKIVELPSSLEKLGKYSFDDCTKLETVTLHNTKIETLEEGVFSNCNNLKNIVIPESVKKIEYYAFNKCVSMESFIIPNEVVTIEDGAFADWTENQTIYCRSASKPDGWGTLWVCTMKFQGFYVPDTAVTPVVWGYSGN